MADFVAVTACNGPRIKDLRNEAVDEVIARFYFDPDLKIGTAFDPDTEPFLFLYGQVWPEAWELPIGIPREEFDPYTTDDYEDGAAGFVELLRQIAPSLEEPLVVQAIGNTKCWFPLSACAWQIELDGADVSVSELGQPCATA